MGPERAFALLTIIGAFVCTSNAQEYWMNANGDTIDGRPAHQNMMLSFRGGWSYLVPATENPAGETAEYRRDLSNGFHMAMQAVLFPSRQLGIGFNADHFWTSAESEITLNDLNSTRTGMWKQDIVINYIGPSFHARVHSEHRDLIFHFNISMGKLFYRNNAVFIDPVSWRGWTTGYSYGLSVDHRVARKASLGLSFNHVFGRLSQMTVDDGTQQRRVALQGNDVVSLSRFDIAAGIKWYL